MLYASVDFLPVNASFCKTNNISIQICNGSPIDFMAKPKQQMKIAPHIKFGNLVNVDAYERTATVFISLELQWNDTSLSIANHDKYFFKK